MDKLKKIMEEEEKRGNKVSGPVANILADMWGMAGDDLKKVSRSNKRLKIMVAILAAATMGLLIWNFSLGKTMKAQGEKIAEINALLEGGIILEEHSVTEETITTTQTVDGDSAVINNGEFEQFNDQAAKKGGDE